MGYDIASRHLPQSIVNDTLQRLALLCDGGELLFEFSIMVEKVKRSVVADVSPIIHDAPMHVVPFAAVRASH